MISRRYSPPFQAASPKPGMDSAGREIKGLVSVEVARSNEISFALESFGCDGKPVLSLLRDLPCETTGRLTVAGTKNGMPFALNSDLPRGLGSAIRGSGGTLRQVTSGAVFRTTEWVLYDSVGNYWSLDELTGGAPTYRGETPDGTLCVQAPRIRPYELRWELPVSGGDPEVTQIEYRPAGCGWIYEASASPVIAYPVGTPPYDTPADYWRIGQWIPDETTPPPGGSTAGAWPSSHRHVECEWYPPLTDSPSDWSAVAENSIDVIVSKYYDDAYGTWSKRVYLNRWTRPLVEHISVGGVAGEDIFLICHEVDMLNSPHPTRVALRRGQSGELIDSVSESTYTSRVMFTPDKTEGWLMQTGDIDGTSVTLRRFRSRETSTDNYGTALVERSPIVVTIPASPAHDWPAEPVWFRAGRLITVAGSPARVAPLLPRWS